GEQQPRVGRHGRVAGALFPGARKVGPTPPGHGRGELVSSTIRVRHDELQRFIAQAFQAKGMGAPDAAVVAETLVWANLRGGDGHGVARVPRYLEMIDRNEMDPRGRPYIVRDSETFFILDAARAAGPVAMTEAVATATERAKQRGTCIALMRDATHAAAI